MSAGYFAVSADGLVRAVATGDQRLSSVEFADVAGTDIAEVSQSVTEAVRAALGTAQRETLAALQSVPGIGDHIPREEGSADA
jgi:DNA-binding protein YbaB